ncbi:pyridoxal phosphate-dependent decarboxylase family protein [Naasia lichenicola]|uniref:Aspartate aminotransferase family protein n=1 Tax=Naasia lichenicola TaxID=2565933 RepID=A0A4S4FQK4_9MICO|nr:pyridoxal-dependent decarboxylase [Naasia lichenicola]THG32850.1 aspartate aminotransferase family protein [Naasia lichenicola]
MTGEREVIADGDSRAQAFLDGVGLRPVYPTPESRQALEGFDESLPRHGLGDQATIKLLDDLGSPGTVATNGGRYFGFVVGASLPVAAAAERLLLAWDNGAAAYVTGPSAAAIEKVAARWMLEILDLPSESAVGFTTSASTGTLIALIAARRTLLGRLGWDLDRRGTSGAPDIRIVTSDVAHISVTKAVRVLGFGLENVATVPSDEFGRLDASKLPAIDDHTIVVLQSGEVNTGESDPFRDVIAAAQAVGAWVHVDGAFGLWARASKHRAETDGVDAADSWTVDGHKWLNTPYDSAMVITRRSEDLVAAMQSDSPYAPSSPDAQKNLSLDFSRRARGVAIWAALRSLGRDGVAELIERTVDLAAVVADGLRDAGYSVLNRVVLNQVLFASDDDEGTLRILHAVQDSGKFWFGQTLWRGKVALRISVSSWRTTRDDVDQLIVMLALLRQSDS